MIRFLITRGHGYTFKHVLKYPQAPSAGLMTYDRLLRAPWLRRATYIFTDLDRLSFWDLELAAHAYLEMKNLGLPVWNNPARAKTRYALLRSLHDAGLNDFNIYRADEIDRWMTSIRFPVFLRKSHGHEAPLSDLLHTPKELQAAVDSAVAAGTPLEHLVATEFAAAPVAPGIYRKLSAIRMGAVIMPHISVHDTAWLVKYGQHAVGTEDLYRDELRLLQTNPFEAHLRKVFELAHIEYGRADFGLWNDRVQVYEINTNPAVGPPVPHPSGARQESMRLSWEKYLEALRSLDTPGGALVRLPNGKLQRRRVWTNRFVRTRKLG